MRAKMFAFFSLFYFCCLWNAGTCQQQQQRTFGIDYAKNSFVMDGKPFRYISGSMHYMRVPPELWMDRMRKIRAAGFNALQFYVQWNLHEPSPGNVTFDGRLDVDAYLEMAKSLGLYVIFRPGPYVCGERDGGGLPYWLYRLHPEIKMRTKDPDYLNYVDKWWGVLLPKMKRHLYQNGGPIILVQMENEYGSFGLETGYCDIEYMNHLVALGRRYLGEEAVFFTTDGDGADYVRCGKVPGAYATVDFGIGADVAKAFAVQRLFEPRGPLVNSEFYPGWFDSWGSPHGKVSVNDTVKVLDQMLAAGASVNIYMAHGGTSFAFEAGANTPPFMPQVTSYDYDALISEAGDLTEKYFAVKQVIAKYDKLPDLPVNTSNPKIGYGTVNMRFSGTFFESIDILLKFLANATDPMTFEQLDQASGFVLYENTIDKLFPDPSQLRINELHDRAYVFVNREPRGVLGRSESVLTMPLSAMIGDRLQILVENQGRVNFGAYQKDFKGITSNVTLGTTTLKGWSMYGMPLDNGPKLDKFVDVVSREQKRTPAFGKSLLKGLETSGGRGSFWAGDLIVPCKGNETPSDTFLSLPGWSKGVAFVNGFNLGRYWPIVGPQLTLYVPAPVLRCQKNSLVLFELQDPGCDEEGKVCYVKFVDQPKVDGPTPTDRNNDVMMFRRDRGIKRLEKSCP